MNDGEEDEGADAEDDKMLAIRKKKLSQTGLHVLWWLALLKESKGKVSERTSYAGRVEG